MRFSHLLYKLEGMYRRARRIVFIDDSFVIYKNHVTRRWLSYDPKFELRSPPVCRPRVNVIERLWKPLHDTVTCNHHQQSMKALMKAVRRFMDAGQSWPGNAHRLDKAQVKRMCDQSPRPS